MKNDSKPTPSAAAPPPASKRPYAKPSVKDFGKVYLLTQGSDGMGEDGGGQMTMMSDRAAKKNIVRIGDHPLGIGLYLFDYKPEFRDKWGQGRQFGVMAQEVETVLPEAVLTHPDGYRMVDYAMLGIRRDGHH